MYVIIFKQCLLKIEILGVFPYNECINHSRPYSFLFLLDI